MPTLPFSRERGKLSRGFGVSYRWVAQLAEQRSPKPQVAGSIPVPPASINPELKRL